MSYTAVLCILLGVFVQTWSLDVINTDLVNANVDRSIDISTQLVKTTYKITLENNGKTPAKFFIFALEQEKREHVSIVSAHTTDGRNSLKVSVTKVQGHDDKLLWRVDLRDNLQPGRSIGIEVDSVLSHYITPYPATITQKEKQLILYNGNHYYYSPYNTLKQTTTFLVGTKNVENYSKLKPVVQSDNNINYGPYTNIPPFSFEKVTVHYENNAPFLTVTEMLRVIEVSHWGNIAIEETISLRHTGAILKGSFSRYDYQRESQSGASSVKSFKTLLPAAATDAYYRDEIGNISTSHMRSLSDSVELDLRPRFPLFGGWKTKYTVGYNVPSYEYLFNAGDEFLLKMRVVDHIFDDMMVDELITKIILPEGSKDIKVRSPYPVQRQNDEWHSTYLDTVGRRVVILKKNNLVENHIQDFELSYTFPRLLMLQEPFLAVSGFYILFLLVIIYVRLDFSIGKSDGKKDD